ncbi:MULTISPECIES: carbamoyltransferase HypF [Natrialbaceae]|uniref:carbamoyltransferase HypF n=1 Tax=Natrialbaceae TaxID=1644061 RepID=UPI00207C80F6|nr:carbamoyltransferase HypF [Natronococcus sp. CG52]
MERATVRVTGVVQSVGFRPFVYRRAVDRDLRGTVRNLGDAGVRIELEGPSDGVDALLADLREDAPPLARVETVRVDRERVADTAYETFEIVDSAGSDGDGGGTIPPDTAICEACLEDVRDPDSRYHDYWAASCVDCGPRFTVVESLPYDRPTTSMAAFPMCDACREEYEEPTDRRYHAQTIACPRCGPRLRYGRVYDDAAVPVGEDADGERDPFPDALEEPTDGRTAIERAAEALGRGETVVLKGIGGAHLACDATDAAAVSRLRERTGRPEKPFAVMAPDADAVRSFAALSEREREVLESPRRPILLLEQNRFAAGSTGTDLAADVAPGLHTVGAMLPYSGLHYLLFDEIDAPLVMTSANLPGTPMLTDNGPLVDGLAAVADGFCLHDRRIVARCDDSLARVVDGERRLVRRSRGFAPIPVPLENVPSTPVLGTGPELDATAGVLHEGECYLTQYLGDVDDLETLASFEDAVDHLLDVTGLDYPPIVAHDAHPEFNTTDYARRLVADGLTERSVAVQHHHAHAASVLAERDLERAVALTLDGVGYGSDGTVWGGEVLDASLSDFERVGGLDPVPMPGGDRATRYPGRMVAGLLYAHDPDRVTRLLDHHGVPFPDGDEERDLVRQQLETDVNVPLTSSAGRFLDAVAALLGVCDERRYEGEPAMKLEALAADGRPVDVDVPTAHGDGRPVVDTPALFAELVDLLESGRSEERVAATAQDALARGLADLAVDAATERNRAAVALTGGVAYNDHVATRIREEVTDAGLAFLGNERIPPGDGGIAYGQMAVAAARVARGEVDP